VIIPTRDRPALLAEAVAAVLAQDYSGEIECLVVFDQSPIRQLEIVPPPGRSVHYLTNQRTPGLPGARNTGVAASKGTYVAHCDDDDRWRPAKLRLQVALAEAHPQAPAVGCGIAVHYLGGVHDRRFSKSAVTHRDLLDSRVATVHSSSLLGRRETYLERSFDEGIPKPYIEDYDWLLRATAEVGSIPIHPEILVDVAWHPGSFFTLDWVGRADSLEYLLAKHPELGKVRRGSARLFGQIAFARGAAHQRRAAAGWALRSLARSPGEARGYLALAVSAGVLKPSTVLHLANRRGKGV